MNRTQFLMTSFLLVLGTSELSAADSYVIRDAKIVTVSGPVIDRGSVVIRDGSIAEVGAKVTLPANAQIIDGRGLTVYPGLFDASTVLGLTEIGQVAATNDYAEMGRFMPHLLAYNAVHVESEHIPVARAAGITHVLTCPRGEILPGQAAIISLDGWTPEEMAISRRAALMVNFPAQPGLSAPSFRESLGARARPYAELKREYEATLRQLREVFDKARHYMQAKDRASAETTAKTELQLEGLVPALKGEQTVIISVDRAPDIKAAVSFAKEQKLSYVLSSASEAWKLLDFLKENQVRLILGPCQDLPTRADDPVDSVYRLPAQLHEKGIPFAIATGSSSAIRNLPHEAGNAVAYGLPYEAALRAVTLTPAEFLGVADQVGSIEKGKKANLVLTTGDILEYQSLVKQVFINGRPASLENKHLKLYEKYVRRP